MNILTLEIPLPRRSKRDRQLKRITFKATDDKHRPDMVLIYEVDGKEVTETLTFEEWKSRTHRYSAGRGLRK